MLLLFPLRLQPEFDQAARGASLAPQVLQSVPAPSNRRSVALVATWRGSALSLILDRANDRGEDRAARATRNYLRDYAADTEVAALCRRNNRWQSQRHDLTEHAAADDA
jgi:hypothetical protein